MQRDVEVSGMPGGQWDLVLIHHLLARGLFAEIPAVLAPGGILVFCQPTRRNLERHDRPGQAISSTRVSLPR
jgi:tellurite methyltransferase